MTITIEFPPETEASLIAQAEARGLRLDAFLITIIVNQAAAAETVTILSSLPRDSEDVDRTIDEVFEYSSQLNDVAAGVYLWSETYDRKLEDIFAIEDDIARSIVSRLQARLGLTEKFVKPSSGYNLEAYQLYLKGRAPSQERTREGLLRSLDCFQKAIDINSIFALAYAGAADAYALLADYGHVLPAESGPLAKPAALRALDIDPSLGEGYCSLAFLTVTHEWKWAEGEKHFRRALALNPSYSTAHFWFGTDLLALIGRFDEALAENELARQLDPLSPLIGASIGYVLMLARRYEEAEQHYRDLAASFPSFHRAPGALGRTLLQIGRLDEAIEKLQTAWRLAGPEFQVFWVRSARHTRSKGVATRRSQCSASSKN